MSKETKNKKKAPQGHKSSIFGLWEDMAKTKLRIQFLASIQLKLDPARTSIG